MSVVTADGGKMIRHSVTVSIDEHRLDEIFRRVDSNHTPGAVVGVTVDGRCVYRKGFGLANMELPLVLTPTTRMRIYSVTKHFVCLAYLLLCESGRAGLDDPIGKHVSGLDPGVQRASIRQLMGHTSGLWDVSDLRWCLTGGSGAMPLACVPGWYESLDGRNFWPGTGWCYNNGAYQLLSIAIERLCGSPLADVLRTMLFEPVGMFDTRLRTHDTDFVANSAAMHMCTEPGRYEKTYLPGELSGEGGIVSTVDDMLRWLGHMDDPRIGTAESWSTLKAPLALVDGGSTGYGLGLFVGRHRGVETLGHSGGGLGASAQIVKVPAAGLNVVVIVNREDVHAPELARLVLEACIPVLADTNGSSGKCVKGVYRSAKTGRIVELYEEGGEQKVSLNGASGFFVCADTEGVLRPVWTIDGANPSEIVLVGQRASPQGIRLNDHGLVDEFDGVPPPECEDVASIAGSYSCDPVRTTATIRGDGEYGRLDAEGKFGSASYAIRCIGENIWRFEPRRRSLPWRGVLVFEPGRRIFRLMTERTWSLRFAS